MHPNSRLALSDGSPLTPQEQFVLKQAAAGEIADLKEEFGGAEEERRLRARFLEELLSGDLKKVNIHRHGVRISNGIIEESLDIENAELKFNIVLDTFTFKKAVSFRDSYLKEHLDLSGSHFFGAADFHRLKVGINFFCEKTIFEGPVDFAFTTIVRQFAVVESKFLAKNQQTTFNGMQVGQAVRFDRSEFHGPVNLGGADIGTQLGALQAKFLSDKHEVIFNAIHVGQSAFFDGAEFHGPVDFVGAEIKEQLRADGSKFLSQNDKTDFHGIQVGQDASFRGCDFHGLVSFVLVKIAGDLHLEPLQLKSGQEMSTAFHSGVNFRGAEIGGELWADKAQFLGHLSDFEAVKVGRNFHGRGSIFVGAARFIGMEVKNDFNISPYIGPITNKALFKEAADFSRVEVTGLFNANQAIFKSENVVFSGIKVGLQATFEGTIFFGGLAIEDGELTNLEINGLNKLQNGAGIVLALDEIVLNRTRIAHRLTLENMEVKRFEGRNLEVKGPAELIRLSIKNEADLRDASLYHLQLIEPDWPVPQGGQKRVYLDGLTYQSLTTRSEPHKSEKWQELLGWLALSRFNAQNFQEMDAFFQRGGLRKWADKVYIAGKRRELGKLPWWHPARWLLGFFWGLLAGFGRKPGRTFWPALVLVLLGWMVFHAAGQPLWTGLAVSLDRFLPGVDLGVAKAFQPASPSNYVWAYWHLEKIMGWVLAPIALAAIYTRIK